MINIEQDSNNFRINLQIKNSSRATKNAIRHAFFDIGKDLRSTAQELIKSKDKHGRVYLIRRGKRLIRHRASSPYEAPANLSGNLKKSIGWKVSGWEEMSFGARESAPYAKFLEEGRPPKLIKRPFLIRSIKENYRNIRVAFENRLKRELNSK